MDLEFNFKKKKIGVETIHNLKITCTMDYIPLLLPWILNVKCTQTQDIKMDSKVFDTHMNIEVLYAQEDIKKKNY